MVPGMLGWSSISIYLWKLALSILSCCMTWSRFKYDASFCKWEVILSPVLNFPLGISLLKECKDFHQAKDGDGWVEQSSQPFLFGLLQKVCTSNTLCEEACFWILLYLWFSLLLVHFKSEVEVSLCVQNSYCLSTPPSSHQKKKKKKKKKRKRRRENERIKTNKKREVR